MSSIRFDFEAGELCLNFANTKEWHASPNPIEHLNHFDDFVNWGEQAGLLSTKASQHLRRQSLERPDPYAAFLQYALTLREAIYSIFSRKYAGESIQDEDLRLLNSAIRQAMSNAQLIDVDGKMKWGWAPESESTDLILWSIARSAADLLTSEKADHVRECEDDRGCGYLFIDQSKNHSRRWCSMESCGNRAKARRHYSKVRTSG